MSGHGPKEGPSEFMRRNLRWLFDNGVLRESEHRRKISRRCSYVLEHLSQDGLLRWAQVSRPQIWQRCALEEFRRSVRKIHDKQSKWSSNVLEYLKELSEEDLKGSSEFLAFYEGIRDRNAAREGPAIEDEEQSQSGIDNRFDPERDAANRSKARHPSETQFANDGQARSLDGDETQSAQLRGHNLLELKNVSALLTPGAYSPAQCIDADCIETVLALISKGIENSVKRRTEKAAGRTQTEAVTMFASSVPFRDGQLLIQVGHDEIWEMLNRSGYVDTRASTKPSEN